MADFPPPPTYAEVVLVDERTKRARFNPIWLDWFVRLVQTLNLGGGTVPNHNSLDGLQGGSATERYHLTQAQQLLAASLAASTYTPTLNNVANLDASTTYQAQYLRVGNTVLVSGKVDANPTAAAAVQLGISLPIASNFGAAEDCAGTAFSPTIAGQGAAIVADAVNDRAEMQWIAVDLTNQPMHYVFAYQVI